MTTQEQSVRDVLVEAKARIGIPQKWCRGHWASKDGRRLCALAAMDAVGGGVVGGGGPALQLLYRTNGNKSVMDFNDSHTHAEVMALFDRAIEAAS